MKNKRAKKCKLPENQYLILLPCPECDALTVEESGDDFDGDVSCLNCGLLTPLCYGTKAAIRMWNDRKNIEDWDRLPKNKFNQTHSANLPPIS